MAPPVPNVDVYSGDFLVEGRVFSSKLWDELGMTIKSKGPSYDTCPVCREQMEHGYIVSNNLLSWCSHVPALICRCGERLDRSFSGCATLEGFRCKKCQIIRYVNKKK